jgi:solute carrier family 38 (sodium-coupled neutral amino acid transporter), member 9
LIDLLKNTHYCYSGAACGLVMVFLLPCLVHMASEKKAGTLTCSSIIFHSLLILLGSANFVAQFFV